MTLKVTCVCGWEAAGPEDDVVAQTQAHGREVHNMETSREQVLAMALSEPGGDRPLAD